MSTYHPLYSGLWNDDHLEGLPFEGKAFFAYLCSNDRLRPSGIYRVTDGQLAADTGLPAKRIGGYVDELSRRGRIVRDGAWLFVVGYLKRQPHQERLLTGARQDVEKCTSRPVLEAFGVKYQLFGRWSTDRLLTLTKPSPDGQVTVERICMPNAVQCSTEQCSTEQVEGHETVKRPSALAAARSILDFLNRKAEKHYQPTQVNLDLIAARLHDGATPEQCRAVIARKVAAWKGDPKMREYLRPATLFGRTNFAQYQGDLPASAFDQAEPDEERSDVAP